MSRPTKQGLDYFPHDVDASNDSKLEALQLIYGFEGYAFYFKMLECIYNTDNCEINISDAETREEILQILSRKTAETRQKFDRMMETALRHGCFDKDAYNKGIISSNGAKKRADPILKKRAEERTKYNSIHKSKDKDKVKESDGFLPSFCVRNPTEEILSEINNPLFYENNSFGKLDANASDKIIDAEKEYSVLYLAQALWIAVKNKKPNWSEVTRILETSKKLDIPPIEVDFKKNGHTPKELAIQIVAAIEGCENIQGYKFTGRNEGEKDYVATKKGIELGYSPEEIIGCREAMDKDEFWGNLPKISMEKIIDNVGSFKAGKLNKKVAQPKEKSVHQKLVEKGVYDK